MMVKMYVGPTISHYLLRTYAPTHLPTYLRAENEEKTMEIVIMVIPVMDAPIIADGILISETDLGNSSITLILVGGIAARI